MLAAMLSVNYLFHSNSMIYSWQLLPETHHLAFDLLCPLCGIEKQNKFVVSKGKFQSCLKQNVDNCIRRVGEVNTAHEVVKRWQDLVNLRI